jgi:hypothetical protein
MARRTGMLYFKACPRCQTGTIEHASDSWGQYLQCLMCGFQRDFMPGADPVAELTAAHREKKTAPIGVGAAGEQEAAVA